MLRRSRGCSGGLEGVWNFRRPVAGGLEGVWIFCFGGLEGLRIFSRRAVCKGRRFRASTVWGFVDDSDWEVWREGGVWSCCFGGPEGSWIVSLGRSGGEGAWPRSPKHGPAKVTRPTRGRESGCLR